MPLNAAHFAELREHYSDATVREGSGLLFIHFPKLTLPDGSEQEALLWLEGTGSEAYATRLLLERIVENQLARNWTSHHFLNKTWTTWSWKDVPPNIRYIEVLANHMEALR